MSSDVTTADRSFVPGWIVDTAGLTIQSFLDIFAPIGAEMSVGRDGFEINPDTHACIMEYLLFRVAARKSQESVDITVSIDEETVAIPEATY